MILAAMLLAGAAFVAFGSMIAGFSQKADTAGYVFFFSIMPLIFLASFPPEMTPTALNRITPWLPTSMALELIGPIFLQNHLSGGALAAGLGLAFYTALFTATGARTFRRQV